MAYERTWQFLPVQGPYANPAALYSVGYFNSILKQMLMGQVGTAVSGLWTLVGSSDGVTSGYDTTDRWGSTAFAASDAIKPWVILSRVMNGVTFYLTLVNPTATLYYYMTTHLSGTRPSGGNTTTAPTQNNLIYTSTILPGPGGYAGDTTSARRIYGGMTTLGDFWIAQTVLGDVEQGVLVMAPVGCKTNDIYPVYMHATSCRSTSSMDPFCNFLLNGQPTNCRNYVGTSGWYSALLPPFMYQHLDVSDISLYDFPAWILIQNTQQSASATQAHARGRLPDVGIASGAAGAGTQSGARPTPVGTVIRDGSNNVIYATLNVLIFPYNALLS